MTTTLSRQQEMTRAIGAKNDESRSRTRTRSRTLSAPLKFMSSRLSPRASDRRHQYAILASSPGSFDRRLFRILVQNVSKMSAFITAKCRFKVKSAGGTCQDGVSMAYFRTCA